MPEAARIGDKAYAEGIAFGCPACPHTVIDPIIEGAPSVFINGLPAAREEDWGVHAIDCGPIPLWFTKALAPLSLRDTPQLEKETKHFIVDKNWVKLSMEAPTL